MAGLRVAVLAFWVPASWPAPCSRLPKSPSRLEGSAHVRRQQRRVELVLGSPKLKRVLADADRCGAKRVWLLGPDEVARGVATVRDLKSGEQTEEPITG